jgi:hypothetical protein
MTIAADFKEGIAEICAELGKAAAIRRATLGTWIDSTMPSKGKITTSTDIAVSLVMTDYEAKVIDGEIIQRGDRMAVVSLDGLSIVPDTKDFLIDSSVVWKIVNVEKPEVNGETITTILQVRK